MVCFLPRDGAAVRASARTPAAVFSGNSGSWSLPSGPAWVTAGVTSGGAASQACPRGRAGTEACGSSEVTVFLPLPRRHGVRPLLGFPRHPEGRALGVPSGVSLADANGVFCTR